MIYAWPTYKSTKNQKQQKKQEIEDSESGKITDKSHLFSDAILFIVLLLSYCNIFDKTPLYPP